MTKHGTTTATASGNLIAGDPKAESMTSLSSRITELLCYRRNTNQCAAICLQHSSLTPRGKCPERMIVFGDDAKAIAAFMLTELERATAEIARLRDALTDCSLAHDGIFAIRNGSIDTRDAVFERAEKLLSEINKAALASSSAPGSPVENHER